ncbi:hypothetical protein HDU76_007426 [Blyttiomyces sp. JEL0837]|nr:hypothetical protein HDU76_007426 [Blyttiomyces sp. JEL0837]
MFIEQDLRTKKKQTEIIAQMTFRDQEREALLSKIRNHACTSLLSIPLGREYLRVTGFTGEFGDFETVFSHICRLDVGGSRSKLFTERLNMVLDGDNLGDILLDKL